MAQVIRGAPRFVPGAAAGGAILTLVPEAEVSADGRVVRPVALVVLTPTGTRRYALAGPARAFLDAGGGTASPQPPTDTAEAWIVPGEDSAGEDPRLGAAFGATEETIHGLRIPLWEVGIQPDLTPVRHAALGAVEIAGGTLTIDVQPGPAPAYWRAALLLGALAFILAYLLRRRLDT